MPTQKKQPLTYAIEQSNEQKIRNYVDEEHRITKVPKSVIVSRLLVLAIKLKEA